MKVAVRHIDGMERLACRECAFVYYNNPRPCVGVLALEENRILLVERGIDPFKGYWDIPGGFMEAGESPETSAIREMCEETGLEVVLCDLLGFYTDTYGPEQIPTLNICYVARVAGGMPSAGSDAVRMEWFALGDLPEKIAFAWEQRALRQLRDRLAGGGFRAVRK